MISSTSAYATAITRTYSHAKLAVVVGVVVVVTVVALTLLPVVKRVAADHKPSTQCTGAARGLCCDATSSE